MSKRYGIWCSEGWVGEYAPEQNTQGEWEWLPALYPTKKAAAEDLNAFTHGPKQKSGYEVRRYRDEVPRVPDHAGDTARRVGRRGALSGDAAPHDNRLCGGTTMSYKVRSTKRGTGGGSYDLSYGKGDAKLTAVLEKGPGGWGVVGSAIVGWSTKRKAMERWGEWAKKTYNPKGHEVAAGAAPKKKPKAGPPKLPARKGPPVFKPSAKVAPAVERPSHPAYDDGEKVNDVTCGAGKNPYLADFLSDKGFFERDKGSWRITPLGALEEIFNYMQDELPFTSTMEYPWCRVTKVLMRAFPNDPKYRPEKT